jgi:stage II sporulation SpoAA-like protein
MSLTIQHEHGNIFRVDSAGILKKADFDRLQTSMAAEIGRLGPIRMLFVLKNFEGWEPGQNWGDLSFYMKHGDSIERIAIVGDERWRSEALMFAAADLRRGPVEFFPDGRLSDARAWLAG